MLDAPKHNSKKSRSGLFISYARRDGKNFADDLRRRLIDEYHLQVWQDIVELEGGKDWWLQIEAAIKSVEYLVMVMTPGALASQTTRKEWRLARQEGVCVLPVMAEAIDFSMLPRWMQDTHFFDFKFPEQWDRFIRTLQSLCQAPRVPFMVEDKPDDFVERPEEFNQLLALLLDPKHEEPIAITVALRGAGGYGKTTLAKAPCHDERIQNAFDDGILWITLGENPGDLTGRVEDLIYTLSGERAGFSSVQAAAARLAELLADRDILLVIDDVWNSAHLRPFLQGGSRCSRLITTRNSDTLPAKAKGIDLDAMRPNEATSLLGFNLPSDESSGLQHLAQRLGEWPLLLKLVNATLRYRVHDLKQSFGKAITFVNAALDECGLIAFDQDNATERHQAVAKTLEVSLQMLDEGSRQRYFELAIFPEDVNIPLATLEKLWLAAGYKPIHIEKLCEKLHKLSLLQHFDLSDRTIRLHDVMRQYLVQKVGADLPELHERFLDAYRFTTPMRTWANLPVGKPYLWRYLTYHLRESGQAETLRCLLLDYAWLANKLAVCEVNALLADYDFLREDRELQLVQSALRLSANQLTQDRNQLTPHLLGRLLAHDSPNIQNLLKQAVANQKGAWLRPLTASLIQPGGSLLRTLEGHSGPVNCVAITPDDQSVVSASRDKTLIVWNWERGQELQILEGHDDWVNFVALTPDGKLAVSASRDETLKVWDLTAGHELQTLIGHTDSVNSVALTPDSQRAISASDDKTLKVWDLATGQELRTLKGHDGPVMSVALAPDGQRAISASVDRTLKVWNLATGQELRTLKGHIGWVNSVALTPDGQCAVSASFFDSVKVWDLATSQELRTLEHAHVNCVALTPDGKFIVSASWDETLKVWDLATGQELRTLKGHNHCVTSVALTPDGQHAVSASLDGTLKVWNLATGQDLRTIKGHGDSINSVALTSDGLYAVSASEDDTTLKVWDLATGRELRTLKGHNDSVTSVMLTPDGLLAVSASLDGTIKVWNLATGQELRTLKGHRDSVYSVALTPDGQRAISASDDGTLKLWNLATGRALRTLKGHDASVNSVALMLNGRCAISASSDKTLKVWNLKSGKELVSFINESHMRAVAITADGRTIVAGDGLGRVHFLRLEGLEACKGNSEIVKKHLQLSAGLRNF
jgi:WD40 repeat protein